MDIAFDFRIHCLVCNALFFRSLLRPWRGKKKRKGKVVREKGRPVRVRERGARRRAVRVRERGARRREKLVRRMKV